MVQQDHHHIDVERVSMFNTTEEAAEQCNMFNQERTDTVEKINREK
jgi:hypothetical protein